MVKIEVAQFWILHKFCVKYVLIFTFSYNKKSIKNDWIFISWIMENSYESTNQKRWRGHYLWCYQKCFIMKCVTYDAVQ